MIKLTHQSKPEVYQFTADSTRIRLKGFLSVVGFFVDKGEGGNILLTGIDSER